MVHDVVILGATIAGLTAAKTLAGVGFDVVVLDPNQGLASAAIGHGVAAAGHADTLARMRSAYGDPIATEHVVRNIRGISFIRSVLATANEPQLELGFVDKTMQLRPQHQSRDIARIFEEAGAEVDFRRGLFTSTCLVLDPHQYADHLRSQAVAAGAKVAHGVTVTRILRRESTMSVAFLNNLAWAREPGKLTGVACLDTLGITPWGRQVRSGKVEWVPTATACLAQPLGWVELRPKEREEAWLVRPDGDRHHIVGRKTGSSGIDAARARLEEELTRSGAEVISTGKLATDPADEGRPIVGASAIPGGYYARGMGRGELMNGTASGLWLAQTLIGQRPEGRPLPLNRRVRASLKSWLTSRKD